MFRKVGAGFRKSRKSLVGIFKGRRQRDGEGEQEEENKFPFGVPGEEASTGVSYATAEGEITRESGESRKSMVFGEREGQTPTQVEGQRGSGKKGRGKKKAEQVVIRGILKSIPPLYPPFFL
jgi:hypothetical protein